MSSIPPPDRNSGQSSTHKPDQSNKKEVLLSSVTPQTLQLSGLAANSAAASSSLSQHSIQKINRPQSFEAFIEKSVIEIVDLFKKGRKLDVTNEALRVKLDSMQQNLLMLQ